MTKCGCLFLVLTVVLSRSFNDRLLQMNGAQLGVVVDRALRVMEMTEALDIKQEIAVGKKKKESAVHHNEEKFFSWLAQKAKEEHLRTKDKSRGPGARKIPGFHPKKSDLSRKGKKWKSQKQMRKDAKEAKKESDKAEKKMKKMKKKISKLKKKIFKKDLKYKMKAVTNNVKHYLNRAKRKIKRIRKKEKKDTQKAFKRTAKLKQKQEQIRMQKKVKEQAKMRKKKDKTRESGSKEKKLVDQARKSTSMSFDGKLEKKLKKKFRSVAKSIKRAEQAEVKDVVRAFSKGVEASGSTFRGGEDLLEPADMSTDAFQYFSRKGRKSNLQKEFGFLRAKKKRKKKTKEAAVFDTNPAILDKNPYAKLFPPLPEF